MCWRVWGGDFGLGQAPSHKTITLQARQVVLSQVNRLTRAAIDLKRQKSNLEAAVLAVLCRLERRNTTMSRVCELSGKGPMSGNKVSHANNKTRRRFLPNLNEITLMSDSLGRSFQLRISAAALRSVDHRGGLDAFLLKAKDDELSSDALAIKKEVVKAQAAA